MMNISTRLSNKIKILSFISIIAVVWMHSFYLECERWIFIHFVQKFVALFADFAVPLFFIISGFLFFANCGKDCMVSFFFSKIKKRVRTLVVPYVIWCTLFIAVIFIIDFFVDYNTDYFAYCRQGKWMDFLWYVYFEPAAFHLWFVRDLFIIILCTPIIYLFIRYLPIYMQLIVLLLLGIFQFIPMLSWGLFWFTIGAMFSIHQRDIFYFVKPKWAILCLVVFCAIIACFVVFDISLASNHPYAALVILLGVVGVWKGSDCVYSFQSDSSIFHYTFFVYCSHIPLLNMIKAIIYPRLWDSPVGCMSGFLLSPVVTVVICLLVGKLLQSITPSTYSILSGGR